VSGRQCPPPSTAIVTQLATHREGQSQSWSVEIIDECPHQPSAQRHTVGEGWPRPYGGRMTKRSILGVLVTVVLAACAADTGDDAPPRAEDTTSSAEPVAEPTADQSRCVPAPATVLADLASSSTDGEIELGPLEPLSGQAVRSDEHDAFFDRVVWIIAMRFNDKAGTEQVGVWASIRTDDNPELTDDEGLPGGLTMSVDETAHSVTVWPYGPETNSGIGEGFDGVAEVRECLR